MGRSVSTPSEAVAVSFQDWSAIEDHWDFTDRVDDLRILIRDKWPTMHHADEWLGREDHVIMSNTYALIGVSEYCGLAAIWLVPRLGHSEMDGLAESWCSQITPTFHKAFDQLRLMGRFSNGEAIFVRIEQHV